MHGQRKSEPTFIPPQMWRISEDNEVISELLLLIDYFKNPINI